MQLLAFSIFGSGALITALIVLTARKPVTAAISMVGTMFCLAGLFILLDAHLIGALQIIVYAGAIMVLFLFVIMLLNLREKEGEGNEGGPNRLHQFLGLCFTGGIFLTIVNLLEGVKIVPQVHTGIDRFGSVKAVGEILFTRYILPFEIASVLLLAAMVGAVILAKKKGN